MDDSEGDVQEKAGEDHGLPLPLIVIGIVILVIVVSALILFFKQ